jgi:hypothetical protein
MNRKTRVIRFPRTGGPLSRAEETLRRSEAYLAEAQKLSHTGSFGWDVSTGKIYWLPCEYLRE